jgi:ABC-type sugar transport system substrate-binding protein
MKTLILAVAFAAGLAAAPVVGAHANQVGKRIAYLGTAANQPFVAGMSEAVVAKAESLGMKVTGFFSPFNPALQAQQVDDVIARKFDIIIMMAVSEHAIIPSLERAKKAGIPVILVTGTIQDHTDLYLTFVGENPVELGKLAAEATVQGLKKSGRNSGKIALITGSMQEGVAPLRVEGFKEVLKRYPSYKIVALEDAQWDTALSEKAAGEIFARFAPQGGIDALYGMSDNQATAAIQAANSAGIKVGLKPNDLLVVSGNCMKLGVGDIEKGIMYATIDQTPVPTAVTAVQVAADYFNGKMPPKHIYLPIQIVTKANIAKFAGPCSY